MIKTIAGIAFTIYIGIVYINPFIDSITPALNTIEFMLNLKE